MKSSLSSPSAGSPNSALPSYTAVALATATCVGSVMLPEVPSSAVARKVAEPAASAVNTPFWSTLATVGVSEVHTKLLGRVWLLASARRANNWSWKPTGSGTSDAVRPVMATAMPPGVSELQAPKLAAFTCQAPPEVRCRDAPTGALVSDAPMSTEVTPIAGPSAAVSTPSYDRNSTSAPVLSTNAMPSGEPFWMPSCG